MDGHPNGKEVVFVRQAGTPVYNIYKETSTEDPKSNLTSNDKYHVDGPEYSPMENIFITTPAKPGTMQIWRMKPDGQRGSRSPLMSTTIGFHTFLRMESGSYSYLSRKK